MGYPEKLELSQRSLYLNEEHEYVMMLVQLDETRVFEEGTHMQFKLRTMVFLIMLFFFKFLFAIQLPSILTVIAIIVMCVLSVEMLVRLLTYFNYSLNRHGFKTVISFMGVFTSVIVVISFVS